MILSAAAGTLLVSMTVLFIHTRLHFDVWSARNTYGPTSRREWTKVYLYAAALATLIAMIITANTQNVLWGWSFGVLVFYFAVTAQTDEMSWHVPKEFSTEFIWVGVGLGVVMALQSYIVGIIPGLPVTWGWSSDAILTGEILALVALLFAGSILFFFILPVGSIGFADYKIMVALALPSTLFLGTFGVQIVLLFGLTAGLFMQQVRNRAHKKKGREGRAPNPHLPPLMIAYLLGIIAVSVIV